MRKKFVFPLVVTALLLAHISNVWRLRVYPLTDNPNHIAEAYLFQVLQDPQEPLRDDYSIHVTPLTPTTIHLYFTAVFKDVELGNRIFYTLYMLLLPGALLLLVIQAGGDRWLALLSALLLYNFSMLWGFAGFTIGIALLLLDLATLIEFIKKPSLLSVLALSLANLVLFYAHAVILLFGLTAAVLCLLLARHLPGRSRLLGLAALLPAALLVGWWSAQFLFGGQDQSLLSFLLTYYQKDFLPSFPVRFTSLLADNKRIAAKPWGSLVSLSFVFPILAGLAAALLLFWRKQEPLTNNPARMVAGLFLGASSLCYFLLPSELPGWAFLYQRFSVFILLGTIWCLSFLLPPALRRSSRILAVSLVVIHALIWFQYFSAFDRVARPFENLIRNAEELKGHSLAAIVEDYDFRGGPVFLHYQDYQLIWNHGPVPSEISEYRFRLVERNPDRLPPYQEIARPVALPILLDRYRAMDYLLYRGKSDLPSIFMERGYRVIDRLDGWVLLGK
jgi:hypothetical protein